MLSLGGRQKERPDLVWRFVCVRPRGGRAVVFLNPWIMAIPWDALHQLGSIGKTHKKRFIWTPRFQAISSTKEKGLNMKCSVKTIYLSKCLIILAIHFCLAGCVKIEHTSTGDFDYSERLSKAISDILEESKKRRWSY